MEKNSFLLKIRIRKGGLGEEAEEGYADEFKTKYRRKSLKLTVNYYGITTAVFTVIICLESSLYCNLNIATQHM